MKMITKVTDYPFMCSYQFCTIPTVQIIKCQQFKFFTIFSYLYYLIFPLFFLFCYLCGPFLLGIFKCYLSCCGHYLLAFFFLAFFLLSMLPFCFISWNTNSSAIWCVERVPVCVPLHLFYTVGKWNCSLRILSLDLYPLPLSHTFLCRYFVLKTDSNLRAWGGRRDGRPDPICARPGRSGLAYPECAHTVHPEVSAPFSGCLTLRFFFRNPSCPPLSTLQYSGHLPSQPTGRPHTHFQEVSMFTLHEVT